MQVLLGPIVGIVGLVSYFTFFVNYPAFRDHALLNLVLVCAGVAFSTRALMRVWRAGRSWWAKTGGLVGLAFSLLCAGLLFGYVFSMSYSMPEPAVKTLALEVLPEVTLMNQSGDEVALHERDSKRLILTFYRGHW